MGSLRKRPFVFDTVQFAHLCLIFIKNLFTFVLLEQAVVAKTVCTGAGSGFGWAAKQFFLFAFPSAPLILLIHPMKITYLPLDRLTASFQPYLGEAVQQVVSSGRYLHGAEVEAFENEFAAYVGRAYCIGVANGLDALTLSLMALKFKYAWRDGDEVIVPAMTFIATAEAVVRAGLNPVLADVDDAALLTVEAAERVRTRRTRAVLPVHLYGAVAPMPELMEWAESHAIFVVEDAAQAHGARAYGRRAGAWGIAAAFSFYPGKNLGALGDGGAVVTDDSALAYLVRSYANYGAVRKYVHTLLGINSRLDEVQAAVLRIKLHRLDADNERRRTLAAFYNSHLNHPDVSLPYGGHTDQSVFHIYPLRTSHRQALQQHLQREGIETLIHYPHALCDQPALSPWSPAESDTLPVARQWAATELSLPLHPLLTDSEVLQVCEAVNRFNP